MFRCQDVTKREGIFDPPPVAERVKGYEDIRDNVRYIKNIRDINYISVLGIPRISQKIKGIGDFKDARDTKGIRVIPRISETPEISGKILIPRIKKTQDTRDVKDIDKTNDVRNTRYHRNIGNTKSIRYSKDIRNTKQIRNIKDTGDTRDI